MQKAKFTTLRNRRNKTFWGAKSSCCVSKSLAIQLTQTQHESTEFVCCVTCIARYKNFLMLLEKSMDTFLPQGIL